MIGTSYRNSSKAVRLKAVAIALCVPWTLMAQPYHYDSSQNADAIVVGDIAAMQAGAANAPLSLRVDRAIKGPLKTGSIIQVPWDGFPPVRPSGMVWGDYGIWLLRASGDGSWRIIPAPGGGARSLTNARYPAATSAPRPSSVGGNPTPLDLIVGELSHAAATLDPAGIDFLAVAEALLRLPATPSLTTAFQQMSQSANADVRALGLTGRLSLGDSSALTSVAADTAGLSRTHLRANLAGAVSGVRDTSPGSVAALGRLTADPVGYGMQINAAMALAKMHTKECLPFLTTLLDSNDPGLRRYAFEGFTKFVNNMPVEQAEASVTMAWLKAQGPAPYRTAETDKHIGGIATPLEKHPEFVAFWKSWWAQHVEIH